MKSEKKKISGFTIAEIILIVILALIMLTMLALNIFFKDENSAVSFLGYSFYNTKDVTMLKNIPANTLVIAKASEKENVKKGSVVLCRIGKSVTLIKVDSIEDTEEGKYYIVKFDYAAENEALRISSDEVIAKAMWQIDGFGNVINFAGSTAGIIISVVIPLLFIIAIQVARIISIRKNESDTPIMEDIGDIMEITDDDEPAVVTFTKPKFIEDVTGKIPSASGENLSSVGHEDAETKVPADRSEKNAAGPLLSYEQIMKARRQEKEPVTVGAPSEKTEKTAEEQVYVRSVPKNVPDKVIFEKDPEAEDFFKNYKPEQPDKKKDITETPERGTADKVVFTPHLDNILPKGTDVSTEVKKDITDASKPKAPRRYTTFGESAGAFLDKTYVSEEQAAFEMSAAPAAPAAEIAVQPEIPEKQEIPQKQETVENTAAAPAVPKKKKKKSGGTSIDELMSMISAEETKLKK